MKKAWLFLGMFILSSTILAQGQGGIPSSGRKVHNMGDPINTRGDDFCPTITADGRTMVFDSKLPDEDNHNLYISYYSDGKWSTPRFIKELNTEYNEETPYITPDGSTLVFASDRPEGMQPSVTADGMRRITFDIYISQNINGMWTAPKPVAGDVNTTRNERSPSLSHDRKTLFFSRWRFRNIEKAQIMKADLSDNAYINSRALPFPVNSDNYDIGFIPSRTRSGFYFSSRREGGHGGWDLYFAPEKNGEFKEIINMGPGINSPDNELFMAEGGSDIFFCSNRYGSLGGYDIFSSRAPSLLSKYERDDKGASAATSRRIEQPKPDEIRTGGDPEPKVDEKKPVIREDAPPVRKEPEAIRHEEPVNKKSAEKDKKSRILFYVVSGETGKPVSAGFRLFMKNTARPEAMALRTIAARSNLNGILPVIPRKDVTHVVIKGEDKNYLPVRRDVKVEQGRMVEVRIELTPLSPQEKRKTTSVFHPIYFDPGSDRIKVVFYPHLYSIVEHLRSNPEVKLRIAGYSDPTGSPRENQSLSLRRAMAVRDYFERMGLDVCNLQAAGMGGKDTFMRPLEKNAGEIRRRVEFQIME